MKAQLLKREVLRAPENMDSGTLNSESAGGPIGTAKGLGEIANQSSQVHQLLSYNRIANPTNYTEQNTSAGLIGNGSSPVMQMMWMPDDGNLVLSDAEWDELDGLIDKYDINVGDIEKGGDEKEMVPDQIKIGIALTDLKAKLVSLAGTADEKKLKRFWNQWVGQGKRDHLKGGLWTAIEVAETGKQCNNEVSDWIRNCLSANFKHYPDED